MLCGALNQLYTMICSKNPRSLTCVGRVLATVKPCRKLSRQFVPCFIHRLAQTSLRTTGLAYATLTSAGKPLEPFKLERYFEKYEFTAPYLMSSSDCEPVSLQDLLNVADSDSLTRWNQLVLGYQEYTGLPALRDLIANTLYTSIKREEVVVMAPGEGIYLAMMSNLAPGDHVVAMQPAYQTLYSLASHIGCNVSFWEPTLTPNGGIHYDVEVLKGLVRPGTRMVVVNFPHNPTGAVPTQPEWLEIMDICRKAGSVLFSDEMYAELDLAPERKLRPAADLYERAVSLTGLSKAYGLAGLRIGWLASHDKDFLAAVSGYKDFTTICNSPLNEAAAMMALKASATLVGRNKAILKSNLALLRSFMQRHSHMFAFQEPQGGPICFPRLTTGEDVHSFCTRVVEESGVLLLPASVYDHPASTAAGHFRVGMGRVPFPESVRQLEAYLAAKPKP